MHGSEFKLLHKDGPLPMNDSGMASVEPLTDNMQMS
jgi:hypothetical protein